MNWILMSGPAMAVFRYAVATGMGAIAARGWVDGPTAQTIGAGIIAAGAAAIGALTSTRAAAVNKVNAAPGLTVVPAAAATRAGLAPIAPVPGDPTWESANAR